MTVLRVLAWVYAIAGMLAVACVPAGLVLFARWACLAVGGLVARLVARIRGAL